MFTIKDHFLFKKGERVDFVATPNHGGRFTPEYLIFHFTAATTAQSSISWFKSKEAKASAHLLIDRSGNVTQFAPLNVICWHAGQSVWNGIDGLNAHSIGIEFVNGGRLQRQGARFICQVDQQIVTDYIEKENKLGLPGIWQKYTDEQIKAGLQVTQAIKAGYNIKELLGHEDVSPGRKTDPGPAFPWDIFGGAPGEVENKTTVDVNLRKGPGTNYEAIKVLSKGTAVEKVREENGWTFVKVARVAPILLGWIKSNYIS